MTTMRLKAEVGEDGVLVLRVPLKSGDIGESFDVTVEPVVIGNFEETDDEWHQFIKETYGSCAGMGLERGDQGEYEEREPIE